MIRHSAPLSGVDAFADAWVASAGYDNQVILWEAKTKTAVARAFHDHLANQCRFSADGRRLVTASSDYTARLWSLPQLRLVAVFDGHEDDVEMAAPSPSGRHVATASRDRTIGIFEVDSRRRLRLEGHRSDVISVEWAAAGDELISSSDDGTVRRWRASDGKLLATIDLGGSETDTVVCTEEGLLFAGNDEGQIVALTSHGRALTRTQAHSAGIKRLAYASVKRVLLSASYDRTIKFWAIGNHGALDLRHEAEVPPAVWCRSCSFAGATAVVFGTFGSSYATYDVTTRAWDLSKVDGTPGVNAIQVLRGSVFSVGDAGILRRDGKPVTQIGSLCNFLISFDGLLLTGGQLGIVFDALTGKSIHQHRSPLNCGACFRRNGREHVILGAYTGEGLVFVRKGDGLDLVEVVRLHDNAVKGVAANDAHLFSVCATGAAALHSIDQLEPVSRIARAHSKISNGAISLPGERFASISRDRLLRIWSLGHVEQTVSSPHEHSIKCLATLPDGSLIATGAYDGTVAVYDVAKASWVCKERPTASGISCLSANAEGEGFLAGSYDGNVYRI